MKQPLNISIFKKNWIVKLKYLSTGLLFFMVLCFLIIYNNCSGYHARAVQKNLEISSLDFSNNQVSGDHSNGTSIEDNSTSVNQYVLMEYEAWFGPQSVKIKSNSPIRPLLTSESMNSWGIGYDSQDELVIDQHYQWLLDMGIDGIVLDHTNNVACTFSPDTFNSEIPSQIVNEYVKKGRVFSPEYIFYFTVNNWLEKINSFSKDPNGDIQLLQFLQSVLGCRSGDAFQVSMSRIKSNNENLFRLFDLLAQKYGKTIKIVVLTGGFESTAWERLPSKAQNSAMDLQIKFYDSLYRKYPNLALNYENKPLILSYFAAPTNQNLFSQLDSRLGNPYWKNFTVRKMGGFMSNQLDVRKFAGMGMMGLPQFDQLWTWIDRLRADPPNNVLGPSYAISGTGSGLSGNSTPEAFTVTMANPAVDGWGDRVRRVPTTRGDLRRSGETFKSFMSIARNLKPTFLLINQFNEFAEPDQGWDEETSNDIEPTQLWGNKYIDLVKEEIIHYRQAISTGAGINPLLPGETVIKPISARAKSELADWPAKAVLDRDVFTIYSSYPVNDVRLLNQEFLAAWLPSTNNNLPHALTRLRLQARFAGGTVYGFPQKYSIYLTDPQNKTWIPVGTYSQQPVNGWVEINLKDTSGSPRSSWGVLIIPEELRTNDPAGPYFQIAGIEWVKQK